MMDKEKNKKHKISELRSEIDQINQELLTLLNKRAKIALEIGKNKQIHGYPIYDPIRELHILESIVKRNNGPFSDDTIISLFKEIFKATATLQQDDKKSELKISRKMKSEDTLIKINDVTIGGNEKTFIFGPCSIESEDQLEATAAFLSEKGFKFLRGGAFKPRTSPYDFQGLGLEGLKIMHKIAKKHHLISVVEIMDKEQLQMAQDYIDIVQIGSRNMHNFSLLKEVGKIDKPIILKRGFSATIEEFKLSAEYIISEGNSNVILCERGIRTFEKATRNTLDISAVPILKQETHLPVIVDVSHAAGRKDIMAYLAKAALASLSDGIMAEIHPNPKLALSDANQQMNFNEFTQFYNLIRN
ncbi:bifunctional 3-deoxy-7-phosphoheptulonate synthase/chorismate mutase [Mycoplasmatota bacterium]|nr:bifunctional 3-deoxy-7-phosphoheptulonate synthase/chorismate mutase [Mycoplasmatota bacterium]